MVLIVLLYACFAIQDAVGRIRELIESGGKPAALATAVKQLTAPNLAGRMVILYDAILGSAAAGEKLADLVKARKAVLQALAQDAPSQLAQLIAMEHFMAGTC